MIKLTKLFFNDRAHVIASIPPDNDYLVIRHQLFLKLLDISTVLLFIASIVYLFFNVDSILEHNGLIPLALLALVIAINFIYLKTASLRIAGTILFLVIYLAFAIPAFTHIIAINYPTYFLLLLPMLALLVLGRSALLITALISTGATIVILYLHDINSYSIEVIAADDRAGIVISGFYILSYMLVIYACSAYEKIITRNKKEILATRKALAIKSKLDPLLDIYSRKALISKFNKLQKHTNPLSQKVSIIALTLNGLRELNQEYGQNFANDVLLIITARMSFELGKNDIIGRISGNEFIIILMTNNRKIVADFFAKLIKDVCEPISFDGYTTAVDIAAGYTFYDKNKDDLSAQFDAITMKNYNKKTVEI
jgi:diguanylate cyclase (GGDEF)-like protein